MAESGIKWTDQQRSAITTRGRDVLVTASAGTGKTAVLSGRCVDIVSDKSTCPDVWSVLVLTFTEAAAEQMRFRIAEQLRRAFVRTGDNHLRHQIMLLQGADISTIHSFCRRLITEHFNELGLDPAFGIIDGDEQKLLKAEIMDKTLDWAWRQADLAPGLEQLLYGRQLRTNDGFVAKIIALSDFLDGVVSRERWYERAMGLAGTDPFGGELGREQKRIVGERLSAVLSQLRYCGKLYENQAAGGNWTTKLREDYARPVEQCLEFLENGDWDRCAELVRNYQKPRVARPRDISGEIAELIGKTVKRSVDAVAQLSDLAVLNPDYLDTVGASVGLQTRIALELARNFDRFYRRAKQAIKRLDFADLEHYALRLLTDADVSNASLAPSDTALALRGRYRYIFVDEYQDINPVQQAILDMLRGEDNIFVVGDVKQSIYAFRGAEPGIFLERLNEASVDTKVTGKPRRVDLNENFRSNKGILDFVNNVFERIMTASFARIDYDESAKLKQGLKDRSPAAAGQTEAVVELHILDENGRQDGSEPAESDDGDSSVSATARQRQAAMIARRIKRMVGEGENEAEFEIYDAQQDRVRPVEYRDIVILMRAPSKRANDYVEILQLAGVPVSSDASAGYFQTTEITDMLSLLKVLDNPQRDIELAAVLRSPLFAFNDTELTEIKIHGKGGQRCRNFHDCVLHYSQSGSDTDLAAKVERAVAVIDSWRRPARRGSLADLLWRVYRETRFLSFVTALPNGRSRRANLLKLHERAIQFEGFAGEGVPSLTRFVHFLERLIEAGQDWSPVQAQDALENAVRIMSIHKSKGLEFPVVFLTELNTPFNKTDLQKDLLVDAEHAIGLQIVQKKSNSKFSSIAHQVIADRKLATALAEEMRILYVATTRARERLILTAGKKKDSCRDIICSGFLFDGGAIPDWRLRTSRSALEWLLYGLSDQRILHSGLKTSLENKCTGEDLLSFRLYEQNALAELGRYVESVRARKMLSRSRPVSGAKKTDGAMLQKVRKSLQWRYQFGDVPLLAAKLSVTQLTHRGDEYAQSDYSRALERRARAAPSVDSADTVDGLFIGAATHLILAELDLDQPVTRKVVDKTIRRLVADGAVTEAVVERIDTDSIIGFFESELGRIIRSPGNSVRREWPFSFTIPASRSAEIRQLKVTGCDQERIIVQGIIDMLVEAPDGLVIIDFKTDRVLADHATSHAEIYRRQLQLYGEAAATILKREVAARWLYFLAPGCAVNVDSNGSQK